MRVREELKKITAKLVEARLRRAEEAQKQFVEVIQDASISPENIEREVPSLNPARNEGEGNDEAKSGSAKAPTKRRRARVEARPLSVEQDESKGFGAVK